MENFDPKEELELGVDCFKKGDQIGAREHWENVPKMEDDCNTYGRAQFFLGLSYAQEDDIERAREHWENVPKREDDDNYGQAQVGLGLFYAQEGDIERAREHWLNVPKREDDDNNYGQAQLNLGCLYNDEGKIEQAREHWLNVPEREDDFNTYGRAQLNLGYLYDDEGDIERARKHWLNVPKWEDDCNTYGRAQLNLGLSYAQEDDIERARKHWLNVPKWEDDDDTYGRAQLNLGGSYFRERRIERARKHWLNVWKRENNDNIYCKAQFYLGCSYYQEGNRKDILRYWNKVLKIRCLFQKNKYNASLEIYKMQRIINYFKDKKSNKANRISIYDIIIIHKDIEKVQNRVNNILKKLYINKKSNFENNFAHYTRADIARIIIRSGYFQLGVSNHMNDSLEGKILLESFNISMCYNNNLYAFLTSFTFNENSLNQFRLYGKEDNKDGTGVSLVIQNNFFKSQFDPEDPSSFINMPFKAVNINDLQTNQSKVKKENIIEKKEDTNKDIRLSEKLPLFRCIYIDPKTDYVSIASKSKASFYASMRNEKDIGKSWKNYSKKINDLSKSLEIELKEIKEDIEEIKNLINKIGTENSKAIYEAIGTTLLPLIYLTKHVAFEEEAECRIFYITSLTNNLVKSSDTVRRLYVEYSTKITALDSDNKIYLEKIYLGPKADSKMELILKKDWIDSQRLKGNQNPDIPKIEKSTLPLA